MGEAISTVDGLVVRESGIWIEEKFYYLERYLHVFSVGMKNLWPDQLYYIDLFSGPGRCLIRENQKELEGSPFLALKHNFRKYFLFENDPDCLNALTKRVEKLPGEMRKKVEIIPGDCNEQVSKTEFPASGLGLAFIDPTGISQIAFETVRRLTENRKLDLLINFPEGMGIRMNLHHYTRNEENALNTFLGSDRWKRRFEQTPTSFEQACREIADEYLENLAGLGYLDMDSDWVPVKTNQNALLYYLLFASKHSRGTDLWHKIGRIDPHGQRKLF